MPSSGLPSLLRKTVRDVKNSISHESSQEGSPARGGAEEDIRKQIVEDEDFKDESDDEEEHSSSTRAKPLDDFLDQNDAPEIRRRYGKLELIQSQPAPDRKEPTDPEELSEAHIDEQITFRGRIHAVRRMSPSLIFIIFRCQLTTLQGVLRERENEISQSMVAWAAHLHAGTIVMVSGKVQQAEQEVKTTTIHSVEILIDELHVVQERTSQIPFSVYEAEAATTSHGIADRLRFAHRILDLRTPTSQAIFRLQSEVCTLFRTFLVSKGFLEIHTPKLQGGATEGGSDVFKLDYFGRSAFLAQSPQLAKQMCISADFRRVLEIGPVFRAENSNTPRHLTEYTGLDLEMEIAWHYHEAMWLIDETLKHIFKGLYSKRHTEIESVKHYHPHEDLVWLEKTPRITFAEGIKMLNESGWKNDDGSPASEQEDLPTKAERELGRLVKEKFQTDYYILDKFPVSARPFYTMLDPNDDSLTNSFDFMVRGQEILTGGQRVHDADLLRKRMTEAEVDPSSMQEYMEAFKWVAPPHAGAGIGLERLLSLIFDLGNIRHACLFPRDPKSFPEDPAATSLRHPEDTTIHRRQGRLQPLENLVANYGDSTNTSWFDKRFQIWRDDTTGAAIAYVPIRNRAILPGNPLCDLQQLPDVLGAFFAWLKENKGLKPIFLLVDQPVEKVLGDEFGWKSFTNVAEQRVNLANSEHLRLDAEVQRKIRHAKREGIVVTSYAREVPPDVKERVEKAIESWQKDRTGEQVHLSDVTPWVDSDHRQYFVAEDRDKKVHAMVVLAQLSPQYGVQLKWALDFPGATNGVIEYTVEESLKAAAETNKSCTFGAGSTSDLASGHNIGMVKATSLNTIYQAYAARFNVDRKTGFRTKFNTSEDPLYFCYPRGAMGQNGVRAIVDFFKDG